MVESLQRESVTLGNLIIDSNNGEIEDIKKEIIYNEKHLKQSKESIELLKLNVTLVDIELKRYEYQKKILL